jgi:hypothetical protein
LLGIFLGSSCVQAGQLRRLSGHVPPASALTQLIDRLSASNTLHLAISLPLQRQPALSELISELYDPASPNFHHFLSPAEFTADFGPTETDYQRVVNFAKTNGFAIVNTFSDRSLLEVRGRVSDVERAFHVHLKRFQHPTEPRDFYAPDVEPSVDSDIPVLFIGGLSSYQLPRPASLRASLKAAPLSKGLKSTPDLGSIVTTSGEEFYGGPDMRNAYAPGVTNTGAGQSIGLVEFDSYYTADISNYLALITSDYGFTTSVNLSSLSNVVLGGLTGSPGSGNLEVALDIDMSICMAPGLSKIYVYEATNDGVSPDLVIGTIATNNLQRQISCSWSGFSDTYISAEFLRFQAQGQSFFQASGDTGAYFTNPFAVITETGGRGHRTYTTNYVTEPPAPPCDDPNITSVGGTTLSTTGPAGSWMGETTWNLYSQPVDGITSAATSGGISTNWSLPTWQQGIATPANQASSAFRNIPDVAMLANQLAVFADNNSNGVYPVAGTSAAAPLWAGLTALINEQLAAQAQPPEGFMNPPIYALSRTTNYQSCFHDITIGNNTNLYSAGLYKAGPGYDLCTGWGSPSGSNLIGFLCPEPLQIHPATGFTSSGMAGGPFSPANEIVVLTNVAPSPFNWALGLAAPWLSPSSTSGVLTNGATATAVTISLNSFANALAIGNYTNTIYFTNLNDLVVQTQRYSLAVTGMTEVTPTVTWTNPAAITYGTALGPVQLNATASIPGLFGYQPPAGTVLGAGTQPLTVIFSPTNSGQYNTATAAVTLVVAPAPLSVAAASTNLLYGQPNPPFQGSFSGVQNGDNITPVYSCSATNGSPVGNYVIVAGLNDPDDLATNYLVNLVNGTLTVNPAPLTATAANCQRAYGSTNPVLTANYSGFVNQDNGSVLIGAPALSTVAATNSPVGSYPILISQGSLSAANYSFVLSNGVLTVTPAPVAGQVTVADKIYDGTTNATISNLALIGVVNGDDVALSAGSAAFTNQNVGTAKVVIVTGLGLSGSLATNYVLGSSVWLTNASIFPLPLTVLAVPDTRIYNGTTSSAGMPDFDPALAGSDTPGFTQAFDTPLIGTGKLLTPLGVVNDGDDGSNYVYTYEPASTGEIDPAGLRITAGSTNKFYGQTLTFAGTEFAATGLVSSDTVTEVTLSSAGAASLAPVGVYSILPSNATGSGLPNYSINYVAGTLTVSASTNQILSVTLNPDGSRTITYTGLPGQNYRLQMTTNLESGVWTDVATNQIGDTDTAAVNDTNNPGQTMVFYRTVYP